MKRYFCTIFILHFTYLAFSQTDSLYHAAKQHAYSVNYAQAQRDLNFILLEHPEHYDALFLQAMVMAWSGEFMPALRQLNFLINRFPPTEEALEAIARINYWAGEHVKAILSADKGLALYPDNENLMYIRAQALTAHQQYDEAIHTLDTLLQEDDSTKLHKEANSLKEKVEVLRRKNAVGVEYKQSRFSNTFTPWHQFTTFYQRKLPRTLMIGRLKYAQMFDQQGVQAEVDAYPQIDASTYAYVNLGFSNATFFPKIRWGAEIFRLLPDAWEASAGVRGLYFQDLPIHIYTAQLGRYFPTYWLSVRAYMSSLESTTPFTALLTARRYLKNEDHYTTLYLGNGATPLKINSLTEVQRLNATWLGIDYQHPLKKRLWLIRSSLEFQQEDYAEIRLTDRLSFTIHLKRRF
ncbi:YaiO family outer membrane protein [Catalinimonas alkaloidigena]|uniref:YaiO family outer membrane beta-barrel protein n=1 Tax=Catalinimonas alkaloidigena TaxID=1075417 RepID=UPI0024049FEA|nr:YaiO family outer membrane beta-barrel protein [Catalinimonas alkaloidigena]MDF9800395.1 YaiO family outer membrane protein [Catalinimonas alkaloidigena]